jgi:hypothetical protein
MPGMRQGEIRGQVSFASRAMKKVFFFGGSVMRTLGKVNVGAPIRLEELLPRLMFSLWNPQVAIGNWDLPTNWQGGVPGEALSAVIGAPAENVGDPQISLNGSNRAAAYLLVDGDGHTASIDLTTNQLTLTDFDETFYGNCAAQIAGGVTLNVFNGVVSSSTAYGMFIGAGTLKGNAVINMSVTTRAGVSSVFEPGESDFTSMTITGNMNTGYGFGFNLLIDSDGSYGWSSYINLSSEGATYALPSSIYSIQVNVAELYGTHAQGVHYYLIKGGSPDGYVADYNGVDPLPAGIVCGASGNWIMNTDETGLYIEDIGGYYGRTMVAGGAAAVLQNALASWTLLKNLEVSSPENQVAQESGWVNLLSVTGVSAKIVANWGVSVSWSNANESTGGFEVQRRTGDGSWLTVRVVRPSATAWLDTSVRQGFTYDYRIRALAVGDLEDSEFTELLAPIVY